MNNFKVEFNGFSSEAAAKLFLDEVCKLNVIGDYGYGEKSEIFKIVKRENLKARVRLKNYTEFISAKDMDKVELRVQQLNNSGLYKSVTSEFCPANSEHNHTSRDSFRIRCMEYL